jgi:RND family efflux transporter MFP subunit
MASAAFDVAAKIGGRVEEVAVRIGDSVQRGQIVARLDDDEYVQQREQARAELAVAQASVDEAQSAMRLAATEYTRLQALERQGFAAGAELERARADHAAAQARLKLAQAQVAQRQAALRAAEVRLGYTLVRANWSGGNDHRLVAQRFVDPGATLAANAPVVSVLDLDPVIAVVHVGERDYVRLRPGQHATVTAAAYQGRQFPAEVVRLAPRLEEDTRQARVELAVANPEHLLKPGMFVEARVVLASVRGATVVPQAALTRRGGELGVFLTDAERAAAHFVPVQLGITQGDHAQILEPALEGWVVTLGQHLLRDGAAIRPVEAGEAPAASGKQP